MTSFERFLTQHADFLNSYIAQSFQTGTHLDMDRYLYHPVMAFSENAGKRHRPAICVLGALAVGATKEAALSAAASVEHFHTAALIHDDIADQSLLRRGEPCLYRKEGVGLAINCGDLALSLVTGTVLRDLSLSAEVRLEVLGELVDMTTRTIEGQALDLGWARDKRFDISIDDYLVMAAHKTAFYSGAVPLVCGAIIGGGTREQIEALRSFGQDTGLAFQIQDDYLNIAGDSRAVGKDDKSDITEGKRTLMVVHALTHATPEHARELIDILESHTTEVAQLDRAVEILREAGSLEYARQYSVNLVSEAKMRLMGVDIDPACKDILLSMGDFFIERIL